VLVADEPVSMVDASLRATILESLRKLNREYGISIIYITHDLTTAYHVASSIIVLYRGSVMEAGDVERVIRDPQHPYTRLLIDSIPWPDINRKWGQTEIVAREQEHGSTETGCKFASRCPFVMDKCRQALPPLGTELEFVIMVIAVSCVKLLSAHNSTQHTSRKHKV
jgi:oligopeptide/dipeptide ABC transporter, ATP-binding protein, C-terminal domain